MEIQLSKDNSKISKALRDEFRAKTSKQWIKSGESETLRIFHEAAERVPAYKSFLKAHNIDHRSIKTFADFASVPAMDKETYLKKYHHEYLVWDGNIKKPLTIHSTSGTTGEPTYFQRELLSDLKRKSIIDNFFRTNEMTTTGPTLFIVTFGMGMWSAGMGIYTAAYLATNIHRYPISIVTPGVNKVEVLKILKNIGKNFKQIIIAGYPPFIKDMLDDAVSQKMNLKQFNLRFVFTGESFPEILRDYFKSKAHIPNIYTDTMNTYGTSELGATAVETPLTIFIKRHKNILARKALFGGEGTIPTLAQYNPYIANLECFEGELYFTGDSTVPLVKYRSGDTGGTLTFNQVVDTFKAFGTDLVHELKKEKLYQYCTELPFVYVRHRKNHATTLYGVLIYPDYIKSALYQKQFEKSLSGKFTTTQKYDKNHRQYLQVDLELRNGVSPTKAIMKMASKHILDMLKQQSSEFRELHRGLGNKVAPKIVLWTYGHERLFPQGTNKHRWIAKK